MADIEHRIATHRQADRSRNIPGRSSTWNWEVPLKQHMHTGEPFEAIRDNVAAEAIVPNPMHHNPYREDDQ